MKMKYHPLFISVLALWAGSLAAAPMGMGTAFTYQGHLSDRTGNPANGIFDLRFALYDEPTGGAQ